MPGYIEIENIDEIRSINKSLSMKLARALRHRESRVIGYPRDTFEATVRFKQKSGSSVFWWTAGNDRPGLNFFGHGVPSAGQSLNIDVQFNLPFKKFSRTSGGELSPPNWRE